MIEFDRSAMEVMAKAMVNHLAEITLVATWDQLDARNKELWIDAVRPATVALIYSVARPKVPLTTEQAIEREGE